MICFYNNQTFNNNDVLP